MPRLILHRAFGSPPARAVMMLADMLSIPLEYNDVKFLQLEHKSPQFKKLNPMGTVPVLQDGDFVLSERYTCFCLLLLANKVCRIFQYNWMQFYTMTIVYYMNHAIMKYLLSKYGGEHSESLYPSEVRTRALVDQCMFFNAGVFFKALSAVGTSTFYEGIEGPSPQHIKGIEAAFGVVDAYLEQRPYIATDGLTLADLAAGSTATAIQVFHKLDANKYPRCADWVSRLQEEDVFKTTNAPGVAYFAKVMHKMWEQNKIRNKK